VVHIVDLETEVNNGIARLVAAEEQHRSGNQEYP
jgi:hypothetical protein